MPRQSRETRSPVLPRLTYSTVVTLPASLVVQAVAHARFGEQVARSGGIGFELAAQLRHVHTQVVRLRLVRGTPHLLQQLPAGDQPPAVTRQDLEQLPLRRRDAYRLATTERDALAGEVDHEVADVDDRLIRRGAYPPGRCAQPGEQLVHAERFRDVVVRAGVEGVDLLRLLAARRQHDDRRCRPAADTSDDIGAVHVGQAEVDDDDVGVVAGHHGKSADPVGGGVHGVVAGAEIDAQRTQQGGLVVYDEHARHCVAPAASRVVAAVGRSTHMVSPPPGVVAATMRPPSASTKPLATASPSPTPPPVRWSPSCWNGSKTCSRCSGAIPGPWSITQTVTVPSPACAVSVGGWSAGE